MKRALATLALAFSTLTAPLWAAAEEAVAPADAATVVIYRADESVKTRRIGLDIHVDAASLGRLTSEDTLLASGAPGTYTLGTSLPGDEPIKLELAPGTTHYVHTRLRMIGNRVVVELVEVEEQVAKNHQAGQAGELLAI
ncbi:MAG: hypothetical protein ABJN62_06960 [Halioglobus sp.]